MLQHLALAGLLLLSPFVFWTLPPSIRLYFLAILSLGLVLYLDAFSAVLLLTLAIGLYPVLPVVARRNQLGHTVLMAVIAVLVGTIVYQKYLPLLLGAFVSGVAAPTDVIVPLGMSYYIFKMIHVAVDAYRRGAFAVRPAPFFCYLFLFTTFSAGPIQRLDLFLEEKQSEFHRDLLVDGFTRIAYGFVKQFFVVELIVLELRYRLVPAANEVIRFDENLNLSSDELWMKVLFVYLIGYLNFSAYNDMAIGASRLFGFRISENFNFPIVARSITEFWQRWHMTLAAWAQAYVYSPILGATRKPYVALYASFAVIGLWHAGTANRLAWGMFHATGVLVVVLWTKFARRRGLLLDRNYAGQALGWTLTQGFVVASMVFVIGEYDNDVTTSVLLLARLLGI